MQGPQPKKKKNPFGSLPKDFFFQLWPPLVEHERSPGQRAETKGESTRQAFGEGREGWERDGSVSRP